MKHSGRTQNEPRSPIHEIIWRVTNTELKYYVAPVTGIILLFILGQILAPGFAHTANIANLLALSSVLIMACFGQNLVILSGNAGIDLTVGSLMSMGALLGATFSGAGSGILYAIIGIALIGALAGSISGVSVQWLNIPPLVMTLVIATVIDGLVLAITKGQPSGSIPPILLDIGSGYLVGPIRWILIIAVILVICVELLLRKTSYGKSLYLTGTNRRAAQLAGIKVNATVFTTYFVAGIGGALAGLFLLASIGSSQMQMGNDYTLLSVAAVVIGGTALSGGKGTFLGSALGAIMITVLTSVLVAVQMPTGARELIKGFILLVILMIYSRTPKLRQ